MSRAAGRFTWTGSTSGSIGPSGQLLQGAARITRLSGQHQEGGFEVTETHMSMPLDSDGFLRRECPTCEREFKWFSSPDGEGATLEAGGYFCPYCGIQAPTDSFFTAAQIELAKNVVLRDLVGPELEKVGNSLRRIKRPGDLVSIE